MRKLIAVFIAFGLAAGITQAGDAVWKGTVNGIWDTSTLNWTRDTLPDQAYVDGDVVTFNNTATIFTITNSGTMSPGSVLVNNTTAYTILANIGGTCTLTKSGNGSLQLSGTNTYSGGLTISAGSLVNVKADSAGTGPIIIAGSISVSPVRTDSGLPRVLPNSLTVSNGVTLTINNATQYYDIGFNGVASGGGTIVYGGNNNGNDGFSLGLFNATNTFTGTTTSSGGSAAILVNSFADSPNRINLNGGAFTLNSGTAAPLLFDNRKITLAGTTAGGSVNNNNGNATNTITINTPLLITGTGAKTFSLGGTNSGTNIFAGAITNGVGSTISLDKSGSGKWFVTGNLSHGGALTIGGGTLTLSGTNTYSGQTIFNAAGTTLILAGVQAVSPNTSFLMNANASTSDSTVKLLDDTGGVNDSTVSVTNTFTIQNNNAPGNAHTFIVGNNNTANGGISSGTTTGSTIAIGTLNWNTYASGTTAYGPIQIQGTNGYRLQINSVVLHNAANLTSPAVGSTFFSPTTANVTLGSVRVGTGNTGQGYQTLVLDGTSSDNRVTGTISDASDVGASGRPLRVTKSNTSTWTFFGTNTYSGTTTVTAGTLVLAEGKCLSDTNSLLISGTGKVQINAGVKEKVGSLWLGGIQKSPGKWGSLVSTAEFKDAYFTGTGLLYVGINIPALGAVLVVR